MVVIQAVKESEIGFDIDFTFCEKTVYCKLWMTGLLPVWLFKHSLTSLFVDGLILDKCLFST